MKRKLALALLAALLLCVAVIVVGTQMKLDVVPAAADSTTVVVAAGDIAGCNGNNRSAQTARLLDTISGTVLALGDNAYESGSTEEYNRCYDPTWGRVKARTYPAPGNHEYQTDDAAGYFKYFGAAAGDPAKGYYSFDLGTWHVVVLNANCGEINGCGASSPENLWLQADLAAHRTDCILAAWHQPRFSSGKEHGSDPAYDAFWRSLYAARADIILNGHDHQYERFAPQNPDQHADPNGIREFVVGTGGQSAYPINPPIANSELRRTDLYGVIKLSLHRSSYDWEYVPVAGENFHDSGHADCTPAPAGK